MPAILKPELLTLPTRLVGERCVLRTYQPGEGDAVFAAVNLDRADLKQWVTWVDDFLEPEDSEAYVRKMAGKWLTREALMFGIWSPDEQEYYGGTGMHGFDWSLPSAEIGYFTHKNARGQGIATEAVLLLTQFAFEHARMSRIWATCDAANEKSWRLLERGGFVREGHLRGERRNPQGRIRDTFSYGMLAREWSAKF